MYKNMLRNKILGIMIGFFSKPMQARRNKFPSIISS